MPLFWLSIAFLAGLVLGASLLWNGIAWGSIAGALILAALIERRFLFRTAWYPHWLRLARVPLGLVLAALALGGLRFITSQPVVTEADLAWYNHTVSYHLSGVIQEPPERSEKTDTLVVAIDRISLTAGGETRQVRGLALVRLAVGQAWRYGDRIELEGAPTAPQKGQNLSYSDALARHSIYTELNYPKARLVGHNAGSPFWAAVYELREKCLQTVNRLLPQPEASLLAGVVLGSVRDMPPAVVEAFRDTGTAHIIAVSGFNIAIISGLFIQVLGRLMRARYAVPLTILAIGGYALLTGAAPSVVRAAIMGGMGLIGPLLGRRQAGVNTLVFTAGIMCLLSPGLPWDISFQLSFAATLGLILFADPLQRGFYPAGRALDARAIRPPPGGAGGRIFSVHPGRADLHPAGHGGSFRAGLAQRRAGQPFDSTGPAPGDDPGLVGPGVGAGLLPIGPARGRVGLAAAGLYHPGRRMAGSPAFWRSSIWARSAWV